MDPLRSSSRLAISSRDEEGDRRMGALNALGVLKKHAGKIGKRGKGGAKGAVGGHRRGRRFTGATASKLMLLKTAVGHGPAFQATAMNWLSKLKA